MFCNAREEKFDFNFLTLFNNLIWCLEVLFDIVIHGIFSLKSKKTNSHLKCLLIVYKGSIAI